VALSQLSKSTSPLASNTDKTITIAQAARIANKHEATVRRWCKKGALPGAHQEGPHVADPWLIPAQALVTVDWCSEADLEGLDERLNPDLQHLANRIVDLEAQLIASEARRTSTEERLTQAQSEVARVWVLVGRLVPDPSPAAPPEHGSS